MKHLYIYFLTTCLIKIGCKQSRYRCYKHHAKQGCHQLLQVSWKTYGAGFWPENPFFCYGTPDFVNGQFVALDDIFDLTPSGRFLVATGPDFGPKIRFLLWDPGFRQWPVCNPRRYLRFGTFRSIFSGRSAGRFPATGPDFSPKIRFLLQDPGFCQWAVCSPRRYLRFGTFGSIFKLFKPGELQGA